MGALAVVSPAQAASWSAGKKAPSAVLAGSGVAWIARGGNRALYEARPSHAPRRIQVFRKPSGGSFAGSGSGVVIENEAVVPATPVDGPASGGTEFFAGPVGKPLDSLGRCGFGIGTGLGRIDISGATLAFVRCDGTVEVRSLGGPPASRTFGASAHAVRLAGRYVAWLEGDYDRTNPRSQADIVVYDLRADVEAYRIRAAAIGGAVRSLALQADGKIAFEFDPNANDTNPRALVAWASRAEPRVHKLPLPRRTSYGVTLVHNRIVFARDSKANKRPFEEMGVTDLKGHTRLFARHAAGTGVDYDGRNVAFAERTCRGYAVVRKRLTSRLHSGPPRHCKDR
jgi:hypothetical protein